MGLDADLIKNDRALARQDADDEYRQGIAEKCKGIEWLLPVLSFEHLIEIRSIAQEIIDDCNERLMERRK